MGRMAMKKMTLVVFAAMAVAGTAMAGDRYGPGQGNGGQGGRGWGWGPGLNVFVDVPTTGAQAGPPQDPQYDHCREARHSCFGQWGVDEPGYGRCMQSAGC